MKKKILVTGSDGFVGRILVKELQKQGFMVEAFDKADGDIQKAKLKFDNINHVIHLAAATFVPKSWENPKEFYEVNIMGTENVLELCRKNQCSLTYINSYIYGMPQYLPIDESHPVKPNTPYNHSKYLGEELCRFYNEYFNMPVTIFRAFNIFGPNQNSNFLIPTIIEQILNPNYTTIKIQNLIPKRDFLYINDFLDILIKSIDFTGYNLFNLGSGKSYSVEQIIKTVFKLSGIIKPIGESKTVRPNEVNDVVANIKLLKEKTGWKPKYSFEMGINEIIKQWKKQK